MRVDANISQTDAVAQEDVQPYVRVVAAPLPTSLVVRNVASSTRESLVEMIGEEQFTRALLSDPSLKVHLDEASAENCCSLFMEQYFQSFTRSGPHDIASQNKAQGKSSTLAAFIPEGAIRVRAEVEGVDGDGDCLFAALSTPATKDDLRKEIVEWEREHQSDRIGLPSPHDQDGLLMCTVREHARANYPSLEFEDYCAIMQVPVREGGLWGESLEAAAFVKMRGCRLNVYVRDPSSSIRPQYARIWHLEGTSDQETEERHLLWSGGHFDSLVAVAEDRRRLTRRHRSRGGR